MSKPRYAKPFNDRRPVRFFHHHIMRDGQIWLDGTSEIFSVKPAKGGGWDIVVMEEGAIQEGT